MTDEQSCTLPINVGGAGQTANRMFRYMYCRNLQKFFDKSELYGYNIPEFGFVRNRAEINGKILVINSGHVHPMKEIAHKILEENYNGLNFNAFALRLEYYDDRFEFGECFKANFDTSKECSDENHITIHVRAGNVISKPPRDYNPVPISFFEQIVEKTRLSPVFVGQFGNDFYTREIRVRFPNAIYRLGGSVLDDFQFIRHSKNIVCSVSSFAWLAAWLSPTAVTIHMPISGFLNPRQRPDVDLLPTDDGRYHFYEFPNFIWRASAAQMDALLARDLVFAPVPAPVAAALRVPAR